MAPPVLRIPATSIASLIVIGMPASGPTSSPRASRSSIVGGISCGAIEIERDDRVDCRVQPFDASRRRAPAARPPRARALAPPPLASSSTRTRCRRPARTSSFQLRANRSTTLVLNSCHGLATITQITTDIGCDQAFSDLSHFDRAAEWDPGVAAGTMLTPEPVGRGSRFALRARFLGRTRPARVRDHRVRTGHVESSCEPRLRSSARSTRSRSRRRQRAGPGATVVTYDARLEPKRPGRLAGPAARTRLPPHR